MFEDNRRKKNIITAVICLALTVLSGFVLLRKFPFVLTSNDDVMLRSIAGGNYTGTPDAHLIYIMYPLGLLLKLMYSVFPTVAWYDLFMTGLHFLCIYLIAYRVSCVFKSLPNKIAATLIAFVVIMIVDMKYVVLHQYTALAGVCAAVAIIWTATYDYSKKDVVATIVIVAMLVISMWLRKQMFFLALPLLLLAFVNSTFLKDDTVGERLDKLHKALPTVAVLAALVLVSFVAEFFAYSSEDWKAFKKFNAARTSVYDYDNLPDYYDNVEFFEDLGIEEKEYVVLREYDIALLDDIGTQELNQLAQKAKEIKKEWASYYSVPRKVINDAVRASNSSNASFLGVLVTTLCVALFILLVVRDEVITGVLVFATCLYKWSFVALFTYLNRLPDRILHGFLIMQLCFVAALFICELSVERNTKSPSLLLQIMMGIFLAILLTVQGIFGVRNLMDEAGEKEQAAANWYELNGYFKAHPDNVYVVNTSVSAAMPAFMFNEKATEAFNAIKPGNWTLSSSLEVKHENRLIEGTVFDALSNMDNVYYVQLSGKPADWLSEFFGEVNQTDTFESSQYSYSVYEVNK